MPTCARNDRLKTLMRNVLTHRRERHEAFDQVRHTHAAHDAAKAEVLSAPALRDLTLPVRNDEDTPEIAHARPQSRSMAGRSTPSAALSQPANPVSSTLVFQRQLRKKT